MTTTYVSIDWGGTHLKGVVIKESRIIKEFELPAGNIKILKAEDLLNICKNIIAKIEPTKLKEAKILIGAAGISDDKSAKRLKESFEQITRLNQSIEVYPDFLCNHASSLGGKDGILSINGTGSILFGVKGKKNIRLGGWGYIFDDTPSGGYFGKKYLEAVLNGLEGSKAHQYYVDDYKLLTEQSTSLGIASDSEAIYSYKREEILNQLYFAPSIQNYLGKYAQNLTKAYEKQEPYALETINKSVSKLCITIKKLSELLELKEINFCGSGGLWDNWNIFRELVDEYCKEININLVWSGKKYPLFLGPIVYYKCIEKEFFEITNYK